MSPGLSKIDSFISEPDHYSEQINLNGILRQALQGHRDSDQNSDMIVHCEKLPAIEADRKVVVKVFDDLVQMVVNDPPTDSRLFLYVDCEAENKETKPTHLVPKYKRYRVNFHTNICTDETWKTAHQKKMTECRAVLAHYGAGFTVNDITSTGCLFSISLLGKM